MKTKSQFRCQSCGAIFLKWAGQCTDCQAWNTLTEEITTANKTYDHRGGYAGVDGSEVVSIGQVALSEYARMTTHLPELDRVLGGGLIAGSVVLLGGDPGTGKSTLLLQTLAQLSQAHRTLYITGEESLQQVALRANRLDLKVNNLKLLAETQIETILSLAKQHQPEVMVVDSIQTVFSDLLQSTPGSVAQVRECAAQLVRFAKSTQTAIFLIGHVTKDGALAGPRVLEHMVDAVLYFEGERDSRFRLIRAIKNRFGAVNELGVFAMTGKGLKLVDNPSALFLSGTEQSVPGSAIIATWEGSRPLLIEIQALVDDSHLANPRRVTVGMDPNRLSMLLAILHRHGQVPTFNQDVFINVVGGVRVTETAADLGVLLAIYSSMRNKALPERLIIFGEVGLAGEIRPVQSGQERLREAAKHGFKHAIIPKANLAKHSKDYLSVMAVENVGEAIEAIRQQT